MPKIFKFSISNIKSNIYRKREREKKRKRGEKERERKREGERERERERASLPLALEIATVLFIVGIVSHRVIYFQPFSNATAVKRI